MKMSIAVVCLLTFLTFETLAGYPSQLIADKVLKDTAAKYPQLVHLFSLGKSVQGREILGVRLGTIENQKKERPKLLLMGGVHGDELVGREILLRFITDAIHLYQYDSRITKLFSQAYIFVIPCLNPDGCEFGLRTNADGIDLNREFPDFNRDGDDNSSDGRAIEVRQWMKFESEQNFALSLVYHGGEIPTVNYPWDSIADAFPQESLAREFALSYSLKNPQMRMNSRFAGGIANGYDWYAISGGMQDWAYYFHQNLQLTVEVTLLEMPPYQTIESHYLDNRDSLFSFTQNIFQGTGFYGMPKIPAKVTLRLPHPINTVLESFNYSGVGSWYKVLSPGKFIAEFEFANGMRQEKEFTIGNRNGQLLQW